MRNTCRQAITFLVRLTGYRDDEAGLDDQTRRRIRAAQLEAVVRLSPLTMTVNVLNAAIITYVFWDSGPRLFLTVWVLVVALLAAAGLLSWRRTRKRPPKEASARAVRRFVLHAGILGGTWGVAPLVLFPEASLLNQLILACMMAGMISGGAFCLSTVPQAGMTYTWLVVAGSVVALLTSGQAAYDIVAFMLLVYGVFISRNLAAHGTLFSNHIRDKLDLEEQKEVIGVLLKDFQAQAGDWLWQTDADGRLIHASDRFADVTGKRLSELEGMTLAEIIGANDEPAEGAAELFDLFHKRAAFRDLVVPVGSDTDPRFWQLSAKPVHDSQGVFNGYRGVGSDITETEIARERINQLAQFDILTGLPSRSFFRETADRALAVARERSQTAALLCIDLDQFKSVNDTLGHQIGDELLARVAERLLACVTDRDLITRLGGDEFTILHICSDGETGIRSFAQQILDSFRAPFALDHGELVIGASVGIAVASGDNWKKAELLRLADMALYSAKSEGAGTWRFFEPEMAIRARRRRDIEVGLREAIERNDLTLVFQPLIDTTNGQVSGLETLARWTSPTLGPVSPTEFIPIAEKTGLIIPIGNWVLREAVKAARRWPDDVTIAVNMSPVQFRSPTLLSTVVTALAESGLPPHRLELEVTESIFVDGNDKVFDLLDNLRSLGVRIALDDFGTGYSSLSYLRRFPFDKIKIDKTFIDDIAMDANSNAIVQAIVALANGLGMSTVAEGVETDAQLKRLRELSCNQIQGYFFSPPLPEQELIALFSHPVELDMAPDWPAEPLRVAARG